MLVGVGLFIGLAAGAVLLVDLMATDYRTAGPQPSPTHRPVASSCDRRQAAAELLQVRADADPEIVDAAYRRLARRHHPDHGGDPARMRALTHARDVLLAGR